MTEMFVLTGEKVGGNLDTHCDAIGKYLIIPPSEVAPRDNLIGLIFFLLWYIKAIAPFI